MPNIRKIYNDLLKQKAVEDPNVRRGDPACWKCLSDEQRDVINEWYFQLLLEKEQEQQAEATRNTWAAIIGLSPLAFFYAISHCTKYDKPFWELLLSCVAALVVYGFIYTLFSYFYLETRKILHPVTRIGSFFFHTLALLISFFVTFCAFARVI